MKEELNSNEVMRRCVLIDKEYLAELHQIIYRLKRQLETDEVKITCTERMCPTCRYYGEEYKLCMDCNNHSNWGAK